LPECLGSPNGAEALLFLVGLYSCRMLKEVVQQVKQAAVEVKVERRSDFLDLNLTLSLNLQGAGGLFQHPAATNTAKVAHRGSNRDPSTDPNRDLAPYNRG